MPVVTPSSARAMASSPCTLAGWRPACAPAARGRCGVMATATRATRSNGGWGEEAPGTGHRHFPEQAADSAPDDDRQRGFDMRSTAEVYELFEKLQQRQGGGGSQHGGGGGGRAVVERRDASGGQALEEGDQVQRSGPLTGRRRRPGLVNSVDPDDDGTGGFDMRSTAEVYAMWDAMTKRQLQSDPVEPHSEGDCPAG